MGAGRLPFWVILINKSALQKKAPLLKAGTVTDTALTAPRGVLVRTVAYSELDFNLMTTSVHTSCFASAYMYFLILKLFGFYSA